MADFLSDLTVGSLSAFIGGGAVVLAPTLLKFLRTQKELGKDKRKTANARSGKGGVAVAIQDSPNSDLDIHVDNSRQITIKNITHSNSQVGANTSKSSGDDPWLIGIAGLVAVGAFAVYFDYVFWFTLGAVLGLLVAGSLAVIRAHSLRLWTRKDFLIAIEVSIALTATIWTWISIFTASHRGVTLDELRTRAAEMPSEFPTASGLAGWASEFFSPVISFVKIAFDEDQLFFALTLTGACVLSSTLLVLAWVRLIDWYTFMGFRYGKGSERAAKKAWRYSQPKGANLIYFIIVGTFVILLASGTALHFVENSLAQSTALTY
ncbi:hypothetical protein G7068_06705 [Leucobacter viscericola]|uniref:Uncharacterized protein n=1 Tax=Leucobacter viscericola TaxID=2714935 RepID=A0A6G7XEE9_9MICO|nr:hypothetical protein [Leucobacter viscericola]QIK62923.1 hypothetical protein G7068_06705 [Leucobacter viscericola]